MADQAQWTAWSALSARWGARLALSRYREKASETAKVVKTLHKEDEIIFLGEEKEGFLKVEGSGSGWVKKIMVGR